MDGIPADRCRVAQGFWRAVEHLGMQPAAVLREARVPVTLHSCEQQLVTTEQFFAIWQALESLSGDSAIGIRFVQASEAAGHQPLFLAACYAADYRDAISRIAQFKRLASPEEFLLNETDREVTIARRWFHAVRPEPPTAVDVSFALLVALGRKGTGQPIAPIRVDYARPGPATSLHHAFFDCPINFDAPRNALVLAPADLDRPFPGRNREILDLLTPALNTALKDFGPESTVSEQVKVVLKRTFAGGRPELGGVARLLGASERTLQRRITDAGTTFRTLVSEARQELCRQLLPNAALDVDEVSCLLGFQDSSSFYRAFREWEGTTPGDWRAHHWHGTAADQSAGYVH